MPWYLGIYLIIGTVLSAAVYGITRGRVPPTKHWYTNSLVYGLAVVLWPGLLVYLLWPVPPKGK